VTGGPAMWHDTWSYRGRGSRRPIEARQWRRRAAVRIGEVLCVGEIEGGGSTGVGRLFWAVPMNMILCELFKSIQMSLN
jgi:hypothetical protein